MMEIDFGTAKKVNIKRYGTITYYVPFYTFSCESAWFSGSTYDTEEKAMDSVKYYHTKATRLRVVKVELPVLNVADNIEIGEE